jgi:C1A family cysteine protease
MRSLGLSLGFLGLAGAAPDYLAMWDQFKVDFQKNYDANGEDEEKRFNIFKDNVDLIEETNAKKLSYELGVNQFADLSNEEFANLYASGFNPQAKPWGPESVKQPWQNASGPVPDAMDWEAKGAVTPVKNQKSCGSCWAFSSTGAMEGALYIATKKLISLSEEDLVQCDHNGDQGCQGGLMDHAFSWVAENGICGETAYPYTSGGGLTGKCRTTKCTPVATVTGHTDVPTKNEDALKQAVAQQPVSVAIEADKAAFQLYRGGVLSNSGCGTKLDHGVLVVGYGTDGGKDYWKVKNSWGPTWGEKGYVRLARGMNECGVAMQPSYPTGAKTMGPSPAPGPSPPPAPPSPSGQTHYGDPASGCMSDEAEVKIQGIQGDLCSPKCGIITQCPTDVPAGVTAQPKCALSAGLFQKRCALVCDPSNPNANECGKATCKAIQGIGICTYDDMYCLDKDCESDTVDYQKGKSEEIVV